MINTIAPHSPPVSDPAGQAPADGEQDADASKTFDQFLPDQSPADKPVVAGDDSASGTVRSTQVVREKATRHATADAVLANAASMAAQLAPLMDLRKLTPAITSSLGLTPPSPPAKDGPSTGADVAASASVPGTPGTGPGGPRGGGMSSAPKISGPATGTATALAAAQDASPATALKTASPINPIEGHYVPEPPPTDNAVTPTVGDSRLAGSLVALDSQVKVSGLSVREEAKIAVPSRPEDKTVEILKFKESQVTESENVVIEDKSGGMSVAESVDAVTATLSIKEKELETSPPAKRGGSVALATPVSGKTGSAHTPESEVITSVAISAVATVEASTSQIAANATPADPTPARQVVRVETLLQQALNVGESVRPDGQGQMEMRVRLGGGAEDVTVRMQVTNDRLQVTFQTASPELRGALESGWQQFSSSSSQTSTLSLAQPRFETGSFDPAATSAQTDAQASCRKVPGAGL